jgi:hypothetical protein
VLKTILSLREILVRRWIDAVAIGTLQYFLTRWGDELIPAPTVIATYRDALFRANADANVA